MTIFYRTTPDEHDVLCESCGTTLTGLDSSAACPKCGREVGESLFGHGRMLSPYEQSHADSYSGFWLTTLLVLFYPTQFFRRLQTRPVASLDRSDEFAGEHIKLASVPFAVAAWVHWTSYGPGFGTGAGIVGLLLSLGVLALCIFMALMLLRVVTVAAAKLSAFEARFHGMRLPETVVRRGLNYHSAAYLPVSASVMTLVLGYRAMYAVGLVPLGSVTLYLYALCVLVVVSAAYLFVTYWIAMRNMMYANR